MPAKKSEIKLAVITGGHSYDVVNFHKLFRSMKGLDVYMQNIDDFASSPKEVRQSYDVTLFYIMMMDGPKNEELPWYAGKPLDALSQLGETRQGILILHHAILAYPQWQQWNDMVGIADRKFGYHIGETVNSHVADKSHPITKGMDDWTMVDETYTMTDAGPDSQVLITYEHPESMKTIAWTRQYMNSRVFCYEAGHDNSTWPDRSFREVLGRGIQWCAGRI